MGMAAIELATVLPNINSGLGNTGFLFGAGTSVEAGYPMMARLTQLVITALTKAEKADLDEVLAATGAVYDPTIGEPNIETIADLVMAHAVNSGDIRFKTLEERLRELVTEIILSVANPKLDHHVRFLELLNRPLTKSGCLDST